MAKFPFVVEPRARAIVERIGSDEAGYIEVKRQGFLSVGERSAYQQITSSDNSTAMVLSATRKASGLLALDMEAAYQAVSDALTAKYETKAAKDVAEQMAEDLADITNSLIFAESNQRLVKAFVMCAMRIDDTFQFEDINEMHPDLIEGLANLFDDEFSKSTERLVKAMKDEEEEGAEVQISQLEEAEKKSPTKRKRASTSRKSTGN